MGCEHLAVDALDVAPSLEFGEFCDSGMKCLGEVFHGLALFLNRNAAWELFCTGKYFELLLMGRVSAAVLFGFRMKQVSAMDCFKKLKIFAEERQWQVRNFPLLMHELASVLQKGLECHKRSPCPVLRYSRYHGNLLFPESILSPDQLTCLPRYIKSTWHPSMRNVGILMVTRKQYQHAGGPRRREELRRLLWWRLWPPID